MFCGNCGKENRDGALFCNQCGAPLGGEKTPEASEEPGKTMASLCPGCGGKLLFDPALGKLKCEYCASVYTSREVNRLWREKEAAASGPETQPELSAVDGLLSYTCSTCGAKLMADKNTAVMRCPYCGNETLAPAQFSGGLRPEFIIPFSYTKEQAEQKYLEFYEKRFLLPGSFRNKSHVEEIQGVYVPFFLYDGRVTVDGEYVASDKSGSGDGANEVSITLATFQVERRGYLDYKKVPADASRRMEDALMDSIEPYEMGGLKPFALSYLPGFLAERYDVPEEECRKRAHGRIEASVKSQVNATIDYDGISERNETFSYEGERSHYALLPVWLLVTKWKNKTCKFALNAQTGKMVGDLPVSFGKMLAVLIPLFFVVYFISLVIASAAGAEMVPAMISCLVAPVFVDVFVGIIIYSNMKSVQKAENAAQYIKKKLVLTHKSDKLRNPFAVKKRKKK